MHFVLGCKQLRICVYAVSGGRLGCSPPGVPQPNLLCFNALLKSVEIRGLVCVYFVLGCKQLRMGVYAGGGGGLVCSPSSVPQPILPCCSALLTPVGMLQHHDRCVGELWSGMCALSCPPLSPAVVCLTVKPPPPLSSPAGPPVVPPLWW